MIGAWNMRFLVLPIASLAFLSGCATVIDEQRTDAVILRGFNAGEAYVVRTRKMQGPQGVFTHTSVIYNGRTAVCRPDFPRDCELAAEALAERADFGNLGNEF